jgi:hypothetical protein
MFQPAGVVLTTGGRTTEVVMRNLKHLSAPALAILATLALAACGTAVGAAGGGLAGSQFGHGSGKTAATVGGVVGGAVIGHAVTGD